jgi:ribonuclease T1
MAHDTGRMSSRRVSTRRTAVVLLAVAGLVLLVVGLFAVLAGVRGGLGGAVVDAGGAGPLSTAGPTSPAVGRSTPDSGLTRVPESRLPVEAHETLALVRAGGPFPHEEDGGTFGNREGLLPPRPRGYYREYTVETPGERDRGPRRLVVGASGDVYWTTDHYSSFRQVEEGR